MKKIISTNIGLVIICLFTAVCVMADFIVIDKVLDSYIVNNKVKNNEKFLEDKELEYVRNTSLEIDGCNYDDNFVVNIKDGNISLLDNFISNNASIKNLVLESGNAKYIYLKKGSHCVSNNLFYITDDNKLYMFKFPYEYIINILSSKYGTVSEVIEQNKLVLIAENAVDFVGNDDNHIVKYLDLNGNIKEYNYYTESFKEEEFILIGKILHQLTAGIYFSGPRANYDVYYAFDEYNNAYEIDQFNADGLDIYNLIDVDYVRGTLTKTGFDNYCNKFGIVESQGNYYRLYGDRGANIFYYKSEFEIVDMSDESIKYKVHNYFVKDSVDLGKEDYNVSELDIVAHDFVLEKEDGVWKVSQFVMPY